MTKRKRSGKTDEDCQQKLNKRQEQATEALAYAKRTRSHHVGAEEKIFILAVIANVRLNSSAFPKGEPCKIAAQLVGRTNNVVQNIWREFVERGELQPALPATDHPLLKPKRHHRLVPSTELAVDVRRFVRERCATRIRTVAENVLTFLLGLGYMEVTEDDVDDRQAAIRCVQRYLAEQGYKRGKHRGATYRLSSANTAQRDEYILRMAVDQGFAKRRKVYMDESYVHHNYASHNDSVYDPTDPDTTKEKHKGRRFCFIAAVIGDDPAVDPDEQVGDLAAHLLTNTIHIFEGGKATNDPTMGLGDRVATNQPDNTTLPRLDDITVPGNTTTERLDNAIKPPSRGKETKDYHGMFAHDYFVVWMEVLLDELDERGFQNCVIVMDNAKYHKVLPAHVPRKKDARQKLVDACKAYELPVNERDTKAILWERLQLYIRLNIEPVIVEMAKLRGHDVVFTPPHFSDLQPIEYVWAVVKGIVGRQYTADTTFSQVRQRLDAAFTQVTPATVRNCIQRTDQDLYALLHHVEERDEDSDSDDESVDSDCASDVSA